MLTISEFAKLFGVSRSTLLHYDSIGLLQPEQRNRANYRLYGEQQRERMELIQIYRGAGMPLVEISRVLRACPGELEASLLGRLQALESDIARLRSQQRLLSRLLPACHLSHTSTLDKAGWVAIMKASGLTEEDMGRWHCEFERLSPEAHQAFLESLGLAQQEVRKIREHSAQSAPSVNKR